MNVNEELETICGEIFRLLSDDFLLKEVKEKIRTALREHCDYLCNFYNKEECERFIAWWSVASKGEQKAFVHLLVNDGRDCGDARYGAEYAQCTGARCVGDREETYRNFGRYIARKLGVDKCLKDSDGFDYGEFGRIQEDLHQGRAVASAVVGERFIFDDETEYCIS